MVFFFKKRDNGRGKNHSLTWYKPILHNPQFASGRASSFLGTSQPINSMSLGELDFTPRLLSEMIRWQHYGGLPFTFKHCFPRAILGSTDDSQLNQKLGNWKARMILYIRYSFCISLLFNLLC